MKIDVFNHIWSQPFRQAVQRYWPGFLDYPSDARSRYEIWWTLGWPYETTAARARAAVSGVLGRHPTRQFVTHHGGGIAPMLEGRREHRPVDWFRMCYAGSALLTSAGATRLALEFSGADRFLFPSDAPSDPGQEPMYIREAVQILDALGIDQPSREKIYAANAMSMPQLERRNGLLRRRAVDQTT